MSDTLNQRIDLLETQLTELRRELDDVKRLAAAPSAAIEPVAETRSGAHLQSAWHALERGGHARALDHAFEALAERADLDELAVFARTAVEFTSGQSRARAENLRLRVGLARGAATPTPTPAPTRAPAPKPVAAAPPARVPGAGYAPPGARARPTAPAPGPSWSDRVVTWAREELTGARLFALAGGVVMALGVVFFFVLAAGRGWVGPAERVALGAVASIASITAGVLLRARYGRVYASVGAVGAGIAGAYTTLAAATVLYGYLPAWGALLTAVAIATVGGVIAVAWSSQLLAGLAFVGAAASPLAIALDDAIDWPGTAIALVVVAATTIVASPRNWLRLLTAVAAVVVGQVAWLLVAAPPDEAGAVAVGAASGFTLLGTATVWARSRGALDQAATSFALAACVLALWSPLAVLDDDLTAGLVLLGLAGGFLAVAALLGAVLGLRDLAWTIGAEALLLGGVGAALVLSGRSLTVVWAGEAVLLAAVGLRVAAPRLTGFSLAFLTAAIVNVLAFETAPAWPEGVADVPGAATIGLFVTSAAALFVGLLLPPSRRDAGSGGVAALLEPLWDGIVRARIELRLACISVSALLLGLATASVLSGRALTLLWTVLAALLAGGSRWLGERRVQALGLAALVAGSLHALAVEAPPRSLALLRSQEGDAWEPVPSLIAVAAAALVCGLLSRFPQRGLALLGPIAGAERPVEMLARHDRELRHLLVFAAAVAATWAAGLVAVAAAYGPGQVVATALWAALGVVTVAAASIAGRRPWQFAGVAVAALAALKTCGFDWLELTAGGVAASAVATGSGLLAAGFALRWLETRGVAYDEVWSIALGGGGAVIAVTGLEQLLDADTRALGAAVLGVATAYAAAGALPYRRWRAASAVDWTRTLANGYWALALALVVGAEWLLVAHDRAATVAAAGATVAALAAAWRPLREERIWLAATVLGAVTAAAGLALVTPPVRLVEASASPATGVWALVVVAAAAWVLAVTRPPVAEEYTAALVGTAAALTLYCLSLGVLELAERVSGASVETDFQRGHTLLSALWGLGALALYVVGLARDRRELRVVGLVLFGLSLAKLFLYDLSTLSSITRALSFLVLGAVLLAAGFFAERLVGPRQGERAA